MLEVLNDIESILHDYHPRQNYTTSLLVKLQGIQGPQIFHQTPHGYELTDSLPLLNKNSYSYSAYVVRVWFQRDFP